MPATVEIVKTGLPALLPRLWRFGMVLCHNPEQASELVQMTCLRALERAEQFEPGTRLDRWCFAIMASIWKNELRGRSVRLGNGHVDADYVLVADARDDLDHQVSVRQILDAVQGLPEVQRLAVLLVYVEGYSYTEAAHLLETPTGTLMSRLAAAKASLARHFGTDKVLDRKPVERRR